MLVGLFLQVEAQDIPRYGRDDFKQLHQELPTPNTYRTASGAPGHEYWQMKADYDMKIRIDDETQKLYGEETITYHNQSPDHLEYLWVQLDQNVRAKDSQSHKIRTDKIDSKVSMDHMARLLREFDGGFKIEYVKDASGRDLPYTINYTMMRIDLPRKLAPGGKYSFKIKWWYNINNRKEIGGRSGCEYFPEDDNWIYTIAQFYPRMAVYCDNEGWQNKQFLGAGEFTLTFGDYKVAITVPSDHVVGSTGVLQNESSVMSSVERRRLAQARTAKEPVMIVTPEEALEKEKRKEEGLSTWVFHAKNVRDFAFASSRKFIWDAMNQPIAGKNVLCMGFYPKEGNPLWEQYNTKVVAHTIKVYSKFTCDYPYPVAISVHTDRIGMEYPMICFNGGRPNSDGTYSERTKYGLISVVIHEVGHNFFPMIINSDERQWTWMDEGLNTFVQYLTEQEWDRDYPSRRGSARKIVDYMKGDKSNIAPIMTNSESIYQFGNNAYGKPATALNILRETVMGRELFDKAFKVYSERWKFKHPTPADFFRTMEDASAVDLDWFWRGWFFTNDHVDLSLDAVEYMRMAPMDPENRKAEQRADKAFEPMDISYERNKTAIKETVVERDPATRDFYNEYDPLVPDAIDAHDYKDQLDQLSDAEKELLKQDNHFYQLTLSKVGGIPMPVILEWEFMDGTSEVERIPAEIWRKHDTVTKLFRKSKEVKAVALDPYLETADIDVSNNYWPARTVPTRFDLYKKRNEKSENPMQRAKRAAEETR